MMTDVELFCKDNKDKFQSVQVLVNEGVSHCLSLIIVRMFYYTKSHNILRIKLSKIYSLTKHHRQNLLFNLKILNFISDRSKSENPDTYIKVIYFKYMNFYNGI